MKNLILMTLCVFCCFLSTAQTGIFSSNLYKYKNKTEPLRNQSMYDTRFLIINFDSYSKKYLIIRDIMPETKQQLFMTYNIQSKLDVNYDKTKNIVETIYLAISEETGSQWYIYKIDDLNDKSLNVVIENMNNIQHCFYNLKPL